MKKILIIADGIVAKHFLERVIEGPVTNNTYSVVYYDENTLPKSRPDNFKFFNFDPTSYAKISNLLSEDFYQAMIITSSKIDAKATYDNIRHLKKDMYIIMMDSWSLSIEDKNLLSLNSKETLALRFSDYLPDVPVIAKNVGLGTGEVMEIKVPFGSSYVYRHLSSIEQKKWRISAIYRGNSLILPRPTLMIQPNDILLAVGNPNVLKSVYKSIKKEFGQFPAPFGNNIYILIDMLMQKDKEIDRLINDSLLLHSKLNSKKLIIRVINPTFSKSFEKIRDYSKSHINIELEYSETTFEATLDKDCYTQNIGLIVVNNTVFEKNKQTLFDIKLPIYKIGHYGFGELKDSFILAGGSGEEMEKSSPIVFDISTQLDLNIELSDFDPDREGENESLIEHYESLSEIFGKKIKVIQSNTNPIRDVAGRKDILHFVVFNEKVLESNMFSIFSIDVENLYFKLAHTHQFFIPSNI